MGERRRSLRTRKSVERHDEALQTSRYDKRTEAVGKACGTRWPAWVDTTQPADENFQGAHKESAYIQGKIIDTYCDGIDKAIYIDIYHRNGAHFINVHVIAKETIPLSGRECEKLSRILAV